MSIHKFTKKWRDKSVDELRKEVAQNKSQQFNNRFQLSTGKLDNYRKISETRRELAVLLTLIRQKELDSAASGGKR
jgi:large subunit ribosomal protein L29